MTQFSLFAQPWDATTTIPRLIELERCICQLCECGQHRCPHSGSLGPSASLFDADASTIFDAYACSEYARQFVPLPDARQAPLRLTHSPRAHAPPPMDLQSTHQHDFQHWVHAVPASRAGAYASAEELMPPQTVPFTAQSVHRADFTPMPLSPRALVPHKMRHRNARSASAGAFRTGTPFGTRITVHQEDFRHQKVTPPKPFVPSPTDHRHGADAKFDASTEHRDAFVVHQQTVPPTCVSVGAARADLHLRHAPNTPFRGRTTHAEDFAAKPMAQERMCPAERMLTRRAYQGNQGYRMVAVRNGHRFYTTKLT